jgi:hypothetical protein
MQGVLGDGAMTWRPVLPVATVILLVAALAPPARSCETRIHLSADWMAGVRGGIEHRGDPGIGVQADLGITPFGLFTADLFFALDLLEPETPYRFDLLLGVPNAAMPVTTIRAGMVSLGGSLRFGFDLTETVGLSFRLGAGFPFFFEEDKDVIRDTPMTLWPDVCVAITFRIL